MNLSSLFPEPSTVARKTSSSTPVVPAARLAATVERPKRIAPGQSPFTVTWPEKPVQTVKDYKVIQGITELEDYFNRCQTTGYASFDYEAAPSDAERARWAEQQKDFAARRLAAGDNKAKLALIDKDYQKALEYFEESPLDPQRAKICTFSISAAPNESRVIFLDHKRGTRNFMPELSRDEARKLFFDIFERILLSCRKVMKIAFNLQYESKMSLIYGRYILAPVADPFIMLVRCLELLKPNMIKPGEKAGAGKDLKTMTDVYLGVKMTPFKATLKKGDADFFDEMDTDDEITVTYSAEDSDYGLQQYLYWLPVAQQIPCGNELYPNYSAWLHGIEMPFTRVMGQMEFNGMMWNQEEADIKREEAEQKQRQCSDEMRLLIKDRFNLDIDPGKAGKTKGINDLLFNVMKLPTASISDKGKVSLDAESVLDIIFMLENNLNNLDEEQYLDGTLLPDGWEALDPETDPGLRKEQRMAIRIKRREPHPYKEIGLQLLKIMQKQQKYATLLSSHIVGRQKYVNPFTGRIHCHYDQWQATGRLAASKPNGQNVPRPDNDEFGIRNLYRAAPGKILLLVDYAGFELRLIAWKSEDKVMITAFLNKEDLHYKTASTMTGKPVELVSKHERASAKAGNFGINYGGTEYALRSTLKKLGIRKSLPECAMIVNAVKSTYPGIPIYFEAVALTVAERGYTETIYGFKRLLPLINSHDKWARDSAKRMAANTPIQGSAADIMKRSQNAIYEKIGEDTQGLRYGWKTEEEAFMVHGHVDQVAQIHDEVILEIDDVRSLVERVHAWVKLTMEKEPLPNFPVPLIAEGSVAYQWGTKTGFDTWLEQKGA